MGISSVVTAGTDDSGIRDGTVAVMVGISNDGMGGVGTAVGGATVGGTV